MAIWCFSSDEIARLPVEVRSQLSEIMLGKALGDRVSDPVSALSETVRWASAATAELSAQEVMRFLAGVGKKIANCLRLFAENGGRLSADQLKAAGGTWDHVAGVEAGITRRTRTILGNKGVYLLDYDPSTERYGPTGEYEGGGEYIMSKVTYVSLRKHFGLN